MGPTRCTAYLAHAWGTVSTFYYFRPFVFLRIFPFSSSQQDQSTSFRTSLESMIKFVKTLFAATGCSIVSLMNRVVPADLGDSTIHPPQKGPGLRSEDSPHSFVTCHNTAWGLQNSGFPDLAKNVDIRLDSQKCTGKVRSTSRHPPAVSPKPRYRPLSR